MIYKGYLEGARWAGIESFLRKGAYECGLEFTLVYEDKGWVRTTIYYEVSGAEEDIDVFDQATKRALKQHNNR